MPTNAGDLDKLHSGFRAALATLKVVPEMMATLAVRSGQASARCHARNAPMEWPTRFHRR
jgi:hypothetical protein